MCTRLDPTYQNSLSTPSPNPGVSTIVNAILTPSSSSSTCIGLIRIPGSMCAFSAACRTAEGSRGECGLDGSVRSEWERWSTRFCSTSVLTKVVRPVPEAPSNLDQPQMSVKITKIEGDKVRKIPYAITQPCGLLKAKAVRTYRPP